MTADRLALIVPDDWHLHLRDGAMLQAVVGATSAHFGRAAVMPNLSPPLTTLEDLLAYRQRILDAGATFTPLMLLYLTDGCTPATIEACAAHAHVLGVKLYPAHATTGSAHGVTDLGRLDEVFAAMAETGLPLLIHGEVTDPDVDVFDREAVFIDTVLGPLKDKFPTLRTVFEHITTRAAVEFVHSRPDDGTLAATITAHHLFHNRNAMFQGGICPHAFCLPVPKRERDREALCEAATSDDGRFFFGSDSAPHRRDKKESSCGCAGVFSAPTALATVAEVFAAHDALGRLEAFLSTRGADFYRQPHNQARLTLERVAEVAPATVAADGGEVVLFRGGTTLPWRVQRH